MHFAPSEEKDAGPEGVVESETGEHAEADGARATRRRFFFLGALAAASAVVPGKAQAQRQARKRAASADYSVAAILPLENKAPPANWASPVVRLVRRATMGLSAEEVLRAHTMGYQGWLNWQINPSKINDDLVNTFVGSRWPQLSQSPEEIYNLESGALVNQLREATIYRAAFSRRQLYERMVEFWSDHFNIAIDKVGYLKLIDDRDVIRKHAMGKFPDLVMASAKSPAMLAYLDQNLSRAGSPNENYARELLELHTLGVDGGYTQQDVVELARVLTGWTLQGRGRFFFDPTRHDWGPKTVMGFVIPMGSPSLGAEGVKEGELFINWLSRHSTTANFISKKMLQWLLTTEPSETQVRAIASVFRSTGGDIRLMVRAILNSGWLPAAPVKLKRPFHLLTSALRGTNPSVTGTNTIRGQLDAMGHTSFDWETPDGYPDKVEYWAGNVITRWSFGTFISTKFDATIALDMNRFSGTAAAIVDAISQNLFGGELAPATRTAIFNYLSSGTIDLARRQEAVALAISSAEFQWY